MKKIGVGLLSIVLLIGIGVRIWYVNKDVELPPVHMYKMGEEVALKKNIFNDDYENMDGYTVTVNNAEIISYEDYLKKYGYEEDEKNPLFETDDMFYPEMVYDLHLTIKNTNETDDPKEHKGINFITYHLTGTDFLLQISDQLYEIANPTLEGGMVDGFRLRADSEMDFHLPFYIQPSAEISPIQVDTVKKDDVYLNVSLYPEVNRILIE